MINIYGKNYVIMKFTDEDELYLGITFPKREPFWTDKYNAAIFHSMDEVNKVLESGIFAVNENAYIHCLTQASEFRHKFREEYEFDEEDD